MYEKDAAFASGRSRVLHPSKHLETRVTSHHRAAQRDRRDDRGWTGCSSPACRTRLDCSRV